MKTLYNSLQPRPSNTHVGNIFKAIKCQKCDEAIYENEFSDVGLAAPTKSIKKLFRLLWFLALTSLQNQPLTANVGWAPILDLVYE